MRKNKTEAKMVTLAKLTAEDAEKELLAILNRWRRRYPAYLVYSVCGPGDLKYKRAKLMHRDIGFLLRLVNQTLG